MVFQIIVESLGLFVAFMAGAYTFRNLTIFCRIVYSQIVLAAVVYAAARAITSYQVSHHLAPNNQWLYNIYIIGETAILLAAATIFVKKTWGTILCVAGVAACLLSFAHHIINAGFFQFANTTQIISGIIVLTTYILMVWHLTRMAEFEMKSSPEVWLILGVCLYFACTVPFMSLIHFLYSRWPETTEILFNLIVNVFGNIRYLLAALSFWLLFKQRRIITNES